MKFGLGRYSRQYKKTQNLEREMQEAANYDEWKEKAQQHDELSGAERWKIVDQSEQYDYTSIRTRIDELRFLRSRHDDHGLLYALNEGVHGNMGGMGRPILHTTAKYGTKKLIEEYITEICDAMEYIAAVDNPQISFEDRLDFFHRASHCYGRSALMLSGGGALGNFHLGVIKVLIEQRLLPVVISGASAGAFIAAIIGTHTETEFLKMYEDGSLLSGISMGAGKFKLDLKHGELIGINEVEEGIARLVPDMTFEEAYKKTGRSINISVSGSETHQTSRLLNAVASPHVLIRSAVMASCAVPGVFPAVTLMARNIRGESQPYLPSRRWADGSFSQDLPAKRLARIFGVNHFIVSQVNPAVLPILSDPKLQTGLSGTFSKFTRSFTKEWTRTTLGFMQRHLNLSPGLHIVLDTVHALVDQEYTGDINIFPNFRYFDPRKLISAISAEEIQFFIDEGEKAAYPKVSAIETNTRIGRTLDKILLAFDNKPLHWLRSAPKTQSYDKEEA